jgi:RimJ/RimL family protein N-acetyltransferase
MSGDDSGRCNCSAEQIQRYRSRISGLLLDRIDIQKGFGEFSITDLKTNEFLGRAGFAELNNGEIEVGYLLLKEYWGKGIASEALSTLLGWAGKALSVPRILAFTPINHHASIGVMKKAGMRYLKTESSHGVECIFYEYLLKPRDTPAKF